MENSQRFAPQSDRLLLLLVSAAVYDRFYVFIYAKLSFAGGLKALLAFL